MAGVRRGGRCRPESNANDDFNGPEQDGVGWYQVTQRNGMRCSAAVAYLHPALERPNLTVETNAHVTRLLLDGRAGRSASRSTRATTLRELRAEREVILARRRLPEPADPAAQRHRAGRPTSSSPASRGSQDLPGRRRTCRTTPRRWITYTTDEPSLLTAETEENMELLRPRGAAR